MKLYHKTYKLFLISCAAELAGTFDIWLHYDKYSRDGIGLPVLKIISMIYRYDSFPHSISSHIWSNKYTFTGLNKLFDSKKISLSLKIKGK
jgi:hypothetical protein